MSKKTQKTPYKIETQKLAQSAIIGQRIVDAYFLSDAQVSDLGWYHRPIALVLENDTYLIPQRDDEGNDAGALMTTAFSLPTIAPLSANRAQASLRETMIETEMKALFKGKRISDTYFLTNAQATDLGWAHRPFAIVLENTTLIFPLRDSEANDAGAWLTLIPTLSKLSTIATIATQHG